MCGFAGLVSRGDVAAELHLALQALQHRGQDSAGIATMVADGTRFHARRGLGTVANALGAEDIATLVGPIGLGHVRYPTIGRGVLEDTQPFFYRQPGVLMAHNGNITNYGELRDGLRERSIHLLSRCDIEPALCEFSDALNARHPKDHTIADAVAAAGTIYEKVRGSFSLAATMVLDGQPTLMVMRDPNGLRPAIIGRRDDGAWMAVSESVALDVLGFSEALEPKPGEVVFLRAGAEPLRFPVQPAKPAPCVFEFVYFARPDSNFEKRSVYEMRLALGRGLASRVAAKSIEADVVVPVPDTSRPAAVAMAEALRLPLREGLIKNRYSGRTFIMPDKMTRTVALRLKLNALRPELEGRRVLLIDDSIVRGATLQRVVALVREAGAAEVHLAIHSPPVRHPCFYGIDMSTPEELFAASLSENLDTLEVQGAQHFEAESLTYLTVDGLDQAFGGARCAACFDGRYPQEIPAGDRQQIEQDRRV